MQLYEQYAAEVKRTLDHLPWPTVDKIVQVLHEARLNRQRVFVVGNGGSASTASHMACDLNKNTAAPNVPRFRVMALTDCMPLFSACANDNGYENVFTEQLANFMQAGDVLVAISASGNSQNVLNAVAFARANQAMTIGWSGYNGGKLADQVDISVVVPNHCIEQIEDIHLMLEHILTTALRQRALAATAEEDASVVGTPRKEAAPAMANV